ncbi:MAG TPA: CPBP family intramembrane metalloprotease, partial [Bacteroidetes bacterium]|nr:CPBP family intramembrane metalloprotease [Bacteroidota bacterium]
MRKFTKFSPNTLNDEQQYNNGSRFANPGISLMLGFSLLIICVMFSSFAAGWIASSFGGAAKTFGELIGVNRGLYRFIQGFSNLASWGMAAILWAIYTGSFRNQLGLRQRTWKGYFPLAAVTILVALPFVEWLLIDASAFHLPESMKGLEQWALSRESDTGGSIIALLGDTSFAGLTANIIVFAVIPAISEELFFRGFLLGTLKRSMGLHTAVWLSAVLFSILHFQFLGFFSRVVLGAL